MNARRERRTARGRRGRGAVLAGLAALAVLAAARPVAAGPAGDTPVAAATTVAADRPAPAVSSDAAAPAPPVAAAGEAIAPATVTTAPAGPVAPDHLLVMLRPPGRHARLDGGYGGGYDDAATRRLADRRAQRLADAAGLRVERQWPMPVLGLDCIVMRLPPGASVAAAVRTLEAQPDVAWAQPDQRFSAQAAPPARGDPLYPLQPVGALWHLDALHAVATGREVRVAVIDSGVDATHPDLAGRVVVDANFVDGSAFRAERHGTAVAGLIAAAAGNGVGLVGVAPDARLLALRACWQAGDSPAAPTVCDSLSLARALHEAIERSAEVINMSLSGPPDPLVGRLIDAALARHAEVVAAVDPKVPDGGFPASHAGVLAVDDLGAAHAPAHAWRAPGRDLPATAPGGGFCLVSGTSFAAAEVSGLLAVMRQSGGIAAATRLVRSRDGGIDACRSVARTATCDAGAAPGLAAAAR